MHEHPTDPERPRQRLLNAHYSRDMAAQLLLAGVVGAIIGSFLNVVIHRLPRGESVVGGRSRCPSCGATLGARDNVPLVSWLLLRGRCRHCAASISKRYPLVEVLTGGLFVAVVAATGADERTWIGLGLVTLLVPVTFIDIDHRIVPNTLLLFAAPVAVALTIAFEDAELVERLVAAAGAGGFLLLAAVAYPRGMGMGDVKLAGVLGLFLGRAVGPAMLVALLSGALVGAAVIARRGAAEGRKTAIPFGPFLALGGLIGFFAGEEIVEWYLDTFL